MVIVETQYLENYGTIDKPYWKAKGGNTHKIANVPEGVDVNELVQKADFEFSHEYAQEYIIAFSVESDDYLSQHEQWQLEYSGKIIYPDPVIEYSDLLIEIQGQ